MEAEDRRTSCPGISPVNAAWEEMENIGILVAKVKVVPSITWGYSTQKDLFPAAKPARCSCRG
jgi:hypothetical protein